LFNWSLLNLSIHLIHYFFVAPGRIPIFCVHFCPSDSPSSSLSICSSCHLFLSLRSILFG